MRRRPGTLIASLGINMVPLFLFIFLAFSQVGWAHGMPLARGDRARFRRIKEDGKRQLEAQLEGSSRVMV
jgi:hypothetical protein